MNIFTKFRAILANNKFETEYKKLALQGKIKPFDKEFLSTLDGKYWHGLPIYYYLTTEMSMGRCYDASSALGLAMGDGAYVMRGDLMSMIGAWGEDRLGHGWVEYGDKVYDTTWQIICDKRDYYKVFKPKVWSKRESKAFAKDISKITDPVIRSKDWYEKNPSSANILIFQVRAMEMERLKLKTLTSEEKVFSEKVLHDLPNVGLKELNEHIDKELKDMQLPNEFEI